MDKREQGNKAFQELINWVIAEENKVAAKLKAEGRYPKGCLGSDPEEFKPIREERNRRFAELKKKYSK